VEIKEECGVLNRKKGEKRNNSEDKNRKGGMVKEDTYEKSFEKWIMKRTKRKEKKWNDMKDRRKKVS
jgi:hypothetical protein